MQFTKVTFGLHGNWFVAGDQLGNVYQFDISKNRLVREEVKVEIITLYFTFLGSSTFIGEVSLVQGWQAVSRGLVKS